MQLEVVRYWLFHYIFQNMGIYKLNLLQKCFHLSWNLEYEEMEHPTKCNHRFAQISVVQSVTIECVRFIVHVNKLNKLNRSSYVSPWWKNVKFWLVRKWFYNGDLWEFFLFILWTPYSDWTEIDILTDNPYRTISAPVWIRYSSCWVCLFTSL